MGRHTQHTHSSYAFCPSPSKKSNSQPERTKPKILSTLKKKFKKKNERGKNPYKKSALCKCQERVLSFTVGHQRERHTPLVGRTFVVVVVVVVVVVCLFFLNFLARGLSLSRRKKERKRWAAVVFMAGKAPRKGVSHRRRRWGRRKRLWRSLARKTRWRRSWGTTCRRRTMVGSKSWGGW